MPEVQKIIIDSIEYIFTMAFLVAVGAIIVAPIMFAVAFIELYMVSYI